MSALSQIIESTSARSTGAGRWIARCPSHSDSSPSLSIREGEEGRVLLYCFANCSITEIVSAVGLKVSDLFTHARPTRGQRQTPKSVRPDRRAFAFQYELAALDLRLHAETIFNAATGLDISTLSDEELDQGLAHVAKGHSDLARAQAFEDVSDRLREKDFAERTSREQRTQAA